MSMSLQQSQKPVLMIVDDAPDVIKLLTTLLKTTYRTIIAGDGRQALSLLEAGAAPELILLDVMMPVLDGYDTCKALQQDPRWQQIPVIFLSAMTEEHDEETGLALGAVDYVTKPVNSAILLARVGTHLSLVRARKILQDENAHLEHLVKERTRQLGLVQDATIAAMAALAEARDNETGHHILRTQHYVRALALQLQTHPRFAAWLTDDNIESLFKSAPLHDIGKVAIPDHILLKPGKLTYEEFEQMKLHTVYGRDTILSVEKVLGATNSFLTFAREIAYSHQEKWDGSGYPQGLQGDDIPASARLMAVADVYDALISKRPYKEPFSHQMAFDLLRNGRGSHFDPDVLDAALAIEHEFLAIQHRFADDVAASAAE
ncbi:MAG: response regulator [Rheinheimera sp.]|nr:response regulator [Rheinheimera sp.]